MSFDADAFVESVGPCFEHVGSAAVVPDKASGTTPILITTPCNCLGIQGRIAGLVVFADRVRYVAIQ